VRKIASILVALVLALGASLLMAAPVSAGAPLQNVTNTPADTTAGETTTDNVTFTTTAPLDLLAPTDQIIITFPAGFNASGASLNAATVTPSGSPPTIASRTATVVTCNVTAEEPIGTFNIVLDNIVNHQTADTYTVSVQTQNGVGVVLQSGTSAPFTITAGAVHTLTVLVHPTDTAAHAIITPPPQVKATDAFGNVIDGQSIAVTLFAGSGTLSGTSPQSANASGIATFDDLSIDERGPNRQLKFTANGVPPTYSNPFNVTAGPATQLVITQQPGGSVSGVALTTQPIVEAQDQYGNLDTTYAGNVTATTNDPGILTGTLSVAVVAGTATFTDLVYTATADHEIFQIDFTSGALTGATSDDVSCDVVATRLVITTQPPAQTISGVAIPGPIVVEARDAANVTDADYTTNVVASEDDRGTLTGTTTVAPAAGVATFNNLVYTAPSGYEVFQVDFTSGALTPVTSNNVACVNPAVGGGTSAVSGGSSVNLASYLNSEGEATTNVNLNSTDGLVTIAISAGTLALDAQGNPLGNIQIVTLSTPPPPPGYVLVGHAYDCLPDGATFQPAITLTFKYTEADIPHGVNEQDLVIAYWDGNQWVSLTTTISAAANTASAKVAHFTPFAILAGTGTPAFAVSDLSINPAEVDIGEEVTISLLVANTGDAAGSYEVTLKIDDVAVATEAVTLAAGASEVVTFTATRDVAGTYAVSVGDLSGTFVVKQAAAEGEEGKPLNPWVVAGIVAAVIAVALIAVMLSRRRA
jgi:hypothetical protein